MHVSRAFIMLLLSGVIRARPFDPMDSIDRHLENVEESQDPNLHYAVGHNPSRPTAEADASTTSEAPPTTTTKNQVREFVKKVVVAVKVVMEETNSLSVSQWVGVGVGCASFLCAVIAAICGLVRGVRADGNGYGQCWLDFVVGIMALCVRPPARRQAAVTDA